MAKIEFFGLYRLDYGMPSIELDVNSVSDLFINLEKMNPVHTRKTLKNAIVLVNDVNIMKLNKYRTKINKGDTVWLMSPASGG